MGWVGGLDCHVKESRCELGKEERDSRADQGEGTNDEEDGFSTSGELSCQRTGGRGFT